MKPADPNRSIGAMSALLGAVVLFSWGAVIVKALAMSGIGIAFWRVLLSALVLGGAALVLRSRWPRSSRLLIWSGLWFGVNHLCFVGAVLSTSITIVTVTGALQPLLVSLMSRFTLRERTPWVLHLWAVIAVLGVMMVAQASYAHPSRSLIGDLLAVASVITYTGFFLVSKRARLEGASALALTASSQVVGLLIIAPAFAGLGPELPPSAVAWGLLLLLAMGPGNGHLLVNWAHPRVSAALASLTIASGPLLAGIWAHVLFDEPFGLWHVAGMLLVGVAIEAGRRAEARGSAPSA